MSYTPSEQQLKDIEETESYLEKIPCEKCGTECVPLHLGCKLCDECCDCRPLGT